MRRVDNVMDHRGGAYVRACERACERTCVPECVPACVRASGRTGRQAHSDSSVTIRITVRSALFRPSSSTASPFEPSRPPGPLWKVGAATRSNGTNTMPYTAAVATIRTAGPPSRWSLRILVLHRVKTLRDTWLYIDF